jgi:NADPH:quinone reductase-like Zn-dependent oxidoreductase
MRAAVTTRYGPPEVVEVREVPTPTPADNEVLVRVRASSVCFGDRILRRGPLLIRLLSGFRPRHPILGVDLAGTVEAVGPGVRRFAPGDAVYCARGEKFAAHAEFACVAEDGFIARKPATMTFEEAGTVFVGAACSLYFLRRANVKPGERVLVHGASGSLGVFAVQLAKYFGAHVSAVCSSANVHLVRSLGADDVIDYTARDFTGGGPVHDVIVDLLGKAGFPRSLRALKPGGRYLLVGFSGGLGGIARALVTVTSLPDGRVLVTGGYGAERRIESSAEFFDPGTGGWTRIGTLRTARAAHTATRLATGAVLIAGGSNADGRTATAEIYMPEISYASGELCAPRGATTASVLAGTPWGLATNSKGHLFLAVSVAGERSRLIEYAPDPERPECFLGEPRWRPIKEIGERLHGFLHSVRIDKDDNIWTVDQTTKSVTKFNAEGRVLLRFGNRPSSADGVQEPPVLRTTPSEPQYLDAPVDLAWDRTGSVFVLDGRENARVVAYDVNGRFIRAVGAAAPGQIKDPHSIAVDGSGNVYVADSGNARIQVFDNSLNPRATFDGIGRPWALCITPGPRQCFQPCRER